MTIEQKIDELISTRFHVLKAGSHSKDSGACCPLELLSVALEIPWTDLPTKVRCFDFAKLSDCIVSDKVRTEHMIPVLKAYIGSLDWTVERQRKTVEKLAILTVQRIVAELPDLAEPVREMCQAAQSLSEAKKASRAASAAAIAAASIRSAAESAAESVFITACQLWCEAAQPC